MKTAKATRYASGPEADIFDQDSRPSAVVAEGWFAANKKHGLLAPYGVGTIDQALLAVLQTKHVFVRLFGLAGKCVILDEVHAYDAYMTTLMERLLRWLAALGCPVVLLSATLPRDRRKRLIDAYAPGAQLKGESASYPRVTIVQRGAFEEQHIDADPGRARTVELGWLKEQQLADQLRVSLATGGCAVVIRNTVGLAQDTYGLRANPTKRVAAKNQRLGGVMVGKRVGLTTEADQLRWLLRKAERSGFGIPGEWVDARHPETSEPIQLPNFRVDVVAEGRDRNSKPGCAGAFVAVRFDGVLVVTDPALFKTAVASGIGSGKAFGFGLLSFAPLGGSPPPAGKDV